MTECLIDMSKNKIQTNAQSTSSEVDLDIPFAGFFDSVEPSFSQIETLRYRDDGEGNYTYFSDVFFVLNMNRIVSTLGADVARSIMASMSASASRKSISPDISDDSRLELTKSRYLQSPSEVSAWFSVLNDRLKDFKDQYDAILQDIHQQEIEAAVKKMTESQNSTNE